MALQQFHGLFQIAVVLFAIADAAAPEGALGLIAPAVGQQDRQGHLALAKIIAHRLAQCRLLRGIIQGVVDQLKSDAKVAAESLQGIFLDRAAAGDDGADTAGGGEQRGGLGGDHVEVFFLRYFNVVQGFELHHLAFRDDRGGIRQHAQHFQAAVLNHDLKSAGKQKIANQNAGLIAPQHVRRGIAPAQVAFVHHVIMQQRGGMDKLHRRRQSDLAFADIAAQPRRRQGQHGPQALAARGNDMPGQLRDQRRPAVHAVQDRMVDLDQIITDQLHQRFHRGPPGRRPFQLYYIRHRAFLWLPATCRRKLYRLHSWVIMQGRNDRDRRTRGR